MTAPEKGFTLLEVMVALSVLAIVLAAVFRLQSSTGSLAEAGYFKSRAPLLAGRKLAELSQDNFDPADVTGEFEDEFKSFSWDCNVQNAADLDGWKDILSKERKAQFKKITLTIYGPGRQRRFTIDTWRFINDEDE